MNSKSIIIQNDVSELFKLAEFVEVTGEEWDLPMKIVFNLNLVLEELISNVIFYAFDDNEKHEIELKFENDNSILKIVLTDDGKEFNPFQVSVEEELTKSAEEREIGGLGIHFVKKLMDVYKYDRLNNRNQITLEKKLN
ncbi:MAG: ATP-binding protein [Saprospiraceae bacterium]|nr:ATP-binding protein [Saprospiraceae bacterium]